MLWLDLCGLALTIVGLGLPLMEFYRPDLTSTFTGWLSRLPDAIEALKPRDTPIWLPFWLVFGPVAAYYIYLPLDEHKVFRLMGLIASLGFYSHSHNKEWWLRQPLAFLLLAPFALPNMLLVVAIQLLIVSLRRVLGCERERVWLRIGLIIAAVGFLIGIVQIFLRFA